MFGPIFMSYLTEQSAYMFSDNYIGVGHLMVLLLALGVVLTTPFAILYYCVRQTIARGVELGIRRSGI